MAKEYVEVEVTVKFITLVDSEQYKLDDDEVLTDEKVYDRFKYELEKRKHSLQGELITASSYKVSVDGTDDTDE